MSDTKFKFTTALIATLISGLAYLSGYVSGQEGWWWTAAGLLVIFGGVFKLIK